MAKKQMVTRSRDWRPVLDGATYCSPACGGGCTKVAFDAATQTAAALAQRLGPGWTARVWENLGWHYAAISPGGCIKVHPNSAVNHLDTTYTAFLGTPGHGGRWTASHADPAEAVRLVRDLGVFETRKALAIVNDDYREFKDD